MARVTILGAGDMGTALTAPLAANGHDVRLWGTELDGAIVAALRAGGPHPRLGVPVAATIGVFGVDEAATALARAEVVVVAVTSVAVRKIVSRLAPDLGAPRAIVTVAKGFDPGRAGNDVQLLPETIGEFADAPVVAVGGPSKANEVVRGLPTHVVFASPDLGAARDCAVLFATPTYRVSVSDDGDGLEVAASMKNAYAIGMGAADGLERATGLPHHNLRAALFPQAVDEMADLARGVGGRTETVAGLAGSGDLQVTLTSGRNRRLGELVGAGERPAVAVAALTAEGTTVEGFNAVGFGYRLALRLAGSEEAAARRFPLLAALWRVLYEDAPPLETLWAASVPRR